ncbi:MAG: DUF2937 family protein [Gammaproteobacteria bacterium]
MRWFGGIVDRLVFVACILIAGALPGFVQQYRQQVDGRLAQVETDLAPFVRIAGQRHDGDIDALIEHHLRSSDETFAREGDAILTMHQTAENLRQTRAGLEGTAAEQMWYLARHVDTTVARSTWQTFAPAIVLNAESLVLALIGGTLLWALLHVCLAMGRAFVRVVTRPAPRNAGP